MLEGELVVGFHDFLEDEFGLGEVWGDFGARVVFVVVGGCARETLQGRGQKIPGFLRI